MTTETAETYFRRNTIKYKRQGGGASGTNLEFACPVCGKAKKATINNATWLWKCWSGKCGEKGNEVTLKRALGHIYEVKGAGGGDLEQLKQDEFVAAMLARASTSNDVERWAYDLWNHDLASTARDYLEERGISRGVAQEAWFGWSHCWPGKEPSHDFGMLMIPALLEPGATDKCAMVKVRSLNPAVPKKARYRRLAGGESVLYAPHGIDPTKTVLLVGGEFDAASVMQAGWTNVCSSTTGEDSWSEVYTQQLAECHDICIIYDNDEAGHDGARKVSVTLGMHRCRVGSWSEPHNDANDCLVADPDEFDVFRIAQLVNESVAPKVAGIIKPEDLRSKVHSLISGSEMGWATGWTDLDTQLGGWRPGEVTLVTGDTGCGKTSFTSQAALFQASKLRRGVLYCPIEMGPSRQLIKWIRQLSKRSPRTMESGEIDGRITQIADMPLNIFHTREKGNIEAMRNTFLYAFARLGVRFIVFDHIHAAINVGRNERTELENIAQMMADVAVDTGMHIMNVAHPHQLPSPQGKDRDNVIVQLGDVKGTSALKQFSDNVLSIWRARKASRDKVVGDDGFGTSVVYLLKVRDEDGQEGRVPFKYHVEGALMLDDGGVSHDLFTHKKKPEPEAHWTDVY